MKRYQNWLASYLVSRRDGDHAMAAELAEMIVVFWAQRGDKNEANKWRKVLQAHRDSVT